MKKSDAVLPLILALVLLNGCSAPPESRSTSTAVAKTPEVVSSPPAPTPPASTVEPASSSQQVGNLTLPGNLNSYKLITESDAASIVSAGYPCHDLAPTVGSPQPQVITTVMYSNNSAALGGVTKCSEPDTSLLSLIATDYGSDAAASAAWGVSMFAQMPPGPSGTACKVYANSICGLLAGNKIWSISKLTGSRGSDADLAEIAGYLVTVVH